MPSDAGAAVARLPLIATREAATSAPGSLHYAGADRWVSMPNGALGSRGRGRSSVEAGPTPAAWRSAPTHYYTDRAVMDHLGGDTAPACRACVIPSTRAISVLCISL